MKIGKILLLAMALGLATTAFAGEETKMKIIVVEDSGDGEIRIDLDSDDIGFSLDELQDGESRSIVDKSGQSIVVTRKADGFTFDVDGETIDMPMLQGDHGEMVWVDEDGDADIDVHVMRNAMFMGEDHMGSTMIMSADPIDEATQQIIKSALESAGHDSEVQFVTNGAHHSAGHDGEHHVKVIRKVIEIDE
ncbi:MAG: hypothetical protein GWP02_02340 [Desulfobulbaceae bacterium]|nr:hypothetical protein [Desulfobulbaceae bacterium]